MFKMRIKLVLFCKMHFDLLNLQFLSFFSVFAFLVFVFLYIIAINLLTEFVEWLYLASFDFQYFTNLYFIFIFVDHKCSFKFNKINISQSVHLSKKNHISIISKELVSQEKYI